MLAFALLACQSQTEGDFIGGSGRFDPASWGDTASGDSGDTGRGEGGDEGAPVFENISGSWEDYPEIGVILYVSATYTDEGGDIVGGLCYIDVFTISGSGNFDGSVGEDATDTYIAVDGTFSFGLEGRPDDAGRDRGVQVEEDLL